MAGEKGIVINISGSGEGAAEALRQIEARMKETAEKGKEHAEMLKASWETVEKAFGMVGIGIGLSELVAKSREAVVASAELGEKIGKVGERTGITAESLSLMHYAAAITGSDFDSLIKGASVMGRNMANAAEGNKTMAAAFRAAHIDAATLSKRTDGIDEAMKKLGQTLSATESPAKRNQIAMALLAKAGSENIPMLMDLVMHWDEYTAHAKAAGVYMDEMTAQKLERLNQSMADLKQRVEGATISFTEGMQSALEGIAKAFSSASQGADIWNTAGKQAGYVSIELAASLNFVTQQLRMAWDEFQSIAEAGAVVDNRINSVIGITGDQRSRAAAAADFHTQQLRKIKTDHDDAIKEQEVFNRALKKAKEEIDHPQPEVEKPKSKEKGSGGGAGAIDTGEAAEKAFQLRMGRERLASQAASIARELLQTLQREDEAELQLAQAKENAELAIIKAGNQAQLQLLESRHAAGIVGFEEYYARRLELTQSALDKEIDVERTKRDQIQQQISQINDPAGAEKQRIAALQRQVAEEQAQIARLGKSGGTQEQQRSIELQQKLIADQTKAAEEEVQNKIRVDGLQKELVASQSKITELAMQRGTAEAQTTAELNQQRWAQQVAAAEQTIRDREKQQAYDAQAKSLLQQGKEAGPEKMNLEAARQASETINGVMDQMAEGALRGKINFHQMADSVILDLERMAMKMMEERSMAPLINSLFGIASPGSGATTLGTAMMNGAKNAQGMNGSEDLSGDLMQLGSPLLKALFNFGSSGTSSAIDAILQQGWSNAGAMSTSSLDLPFLAGGGDIDNGWAVVGDGGDGSGSELFAPKGPGTVLPHDVLEGLAANRGGGGGAPNVTINTINNSSSPVQQTTAGVNYDSQAKQFIIHTVLEDMNQGGPVSAAMSGFARS